MNAPSDREPVKKGVKSLATDPATRAIDDALAHGAAVMKFVSANDVGLTGGHQWGYYLPKHARHLFTSIIPEK